MRQKPNSRSGNVSIEAFAATIRYHDSGNAGDPWSFCCTATLGSDSAHLFAGMGKMTPEIMRAVLNSLRGLGIVRVEWEQAHNGIVRQVVMRDANGKWRQEKR